MENVMTHEDVLGTYQHILRKFHGQDQTGIAREATNKTIAWRRNARSSLNVI
jgi:hypothetical protein